MQMREPDSMYTVVAPDVNPFGRKRIVWGPTLKGFIFTASAAFIWCRVANPQGSRMICLSAFGHCLTATRQLPLGFKTRHVRFGAWILHAY